MNRILKQRARQLYGSRFGRLLLVFLLHFAYSSATSILPYLFQVQLERQGVNSWASFFASAIVQMVVILLFGPLLLGVCRYVYLLQKERDPGLGDVFYHLTSLGRYGRGMAAGALWNLSSCLLLLTASLMDSTGNDGLDVLLGLLMIAVYIFCIYWSLHICLLPYIVAEDENAQLGHIRRESFRLMRGTCGRFFGLLLSFIGWYLLIVFIVVIVVMAVLMPEIIRAVEMGLPTMPEELIDQYSIWINLGAFLLLTLLTPYVALTKADGGAGLAGADALRLVAYHQLAAACLAPVSAVPLLSSVSDISSAGAQYHLLAGGSRVVPAGTAPAPAGCLFCCTAGGGGSVRGLLPGAGDESQEL